MKDHLWKKGKSANPKGCPKGAHHEGRPPEWLRLKCQNIVDKNELLKVLSDVATGADMEQVVTENGETVSVPAAIKERLKAIEILLKHGWPASDKEQTTPAESVMHAAAAFKILRELELNADRLQTVPN